MADWDSIVRRAVPERDVVRRDAPTPQPVPGQDPEAGQRAARMEEAVEALSEEFTPARRARKRYLESWEPITHRAKTGAAAGAVLGLGAGNPPLALGLAALGGATGAAGGLVERQTGSGLAGDVTEVITDPMMLGMKGVIGATRLAPRVSRMLAGSGFDPGSMGRIGADEATEIVRRGVAGMQQDVDMAYDLARQMAPDASVDPELVRRAIGDQRFERIVKGFDRRDWQVDDWIDWNRLDEIRMAVGDEAQAAADAGRKNLARQLRDKRRSLDDIYDELARQSPEGDEAMDALQAARARRTELGRVVPGAGKPPATRLVEAAVEELESGRSLAPDDFIHSVFQNKKGRRLAVRQMREAAKRGGELERFDRELRTSYLAWLRQRGAGGPTEAVVHKAPTIARKLAATKDVAQDIFSPSQYKFLQENLEALSKASGGGSTRVALPVTERIRNFAIASGAITSPVSFAAGADPVVATALGLSSAGTVAGGKYAIDWIIREYGPRFARELAMNALYDKNLMAKLSKAAGSGEGPRLARSLMDYAVRRGVMSIDTAARLAEESIQENRESDELEGLRMTGALGEESNG